jgi:hypothetical protein
LEFSEHFEKIKKFGVLTGGKSGRLASLGGWAVNASIGPESFDGGLPDTSVKATPQLNRFRQFLRVMIFFASELV